MRTLGSKTRRGLPLGACVVAGVSLGAALFACSGGSGESPSEPRPRPTARATAFVNCGELQAYLVALAATEARLRGQIGFGAGSGPPAAGEPGVPTAGADQALAEARAHTETTLQEAGVDEPDFVKSDGAYLYVLAGGNLVLVDAWPPAEAGEVSRLTVAGTPLALFVQGSTVAVVSSLWPDLPGPLPLDMPIRAPVRVRVTLVDATDKGAPRVLRELTYEGGYADARVVAGRLHLVLANDLYTLWPGGAPPAGGGAGAAELLPVASDRLHGAEGVTEALEPATACENTYFPSVPNGAGLLSLVTLDLAQPSGPVHGISLVSASGTVYASAESLYLATPNAGVWGWWDAAGQVPGEPQFTTVVHKFSLGAEPAYAASGEVVGWVLNRYSLGEHAGVLRLATTEERWWDASGPRNRLFVLEQEGQSLKEVGSLAGLGKPGERIYAVRFLGDRGYVVTFRQIDPLYVLDLADPAAPAVLGELEVPGFSTYLHPLEGGYLLAIGQNVDPGGVDLSLFDVRDPRRPALLHRQPVGAGSYSEAQYDPHAFTYFAEEGLLALPMTQWNGDPTVDAFAAMDVFTGLHLYGVDPVVGFTLRGRVDHGEFYRDEPQQLWYWPQEVRRSFFIREEPVGTHLYSVSPRGIKVNRASDLADVAAVPLPAEGIPWLEGYAGPL